MRFARFVACFGIAFVMRAEGQEPVTEVVVLGVEHSGMLVAESYQPAVLRAYIARVRPTAICVERSPEEFARGSHYEFTYEIQDIAVPYAREHNIPICAFDWLPDVEDQLLAFNTNLEEPPFLRGPGSYSNFLTYRDSLALKRDLFYAENTAIGAQHRAWYEAMPARVRGDFARRLFLYRTFMQAMRIARAATEYPNGRILVIVGTMHKHDIERILADQHGVKIVSPEQYGRPTRAEIDREIRDVDLAAVANFSLLGAQASTGNIDRAWLGRVVERLQRTRPGAETELLRTRLSVLTARMTTAKAVEEYRRIAALPDAARRFTWDGVRDRRRVDSFADPFGNLTIAERSRVEQARETIRAGRPAAEAEAIRLELEKNMPPLKAAQFRAYWSEWILPAPAR